MKIVVIGAGIVGSTIAYHLALKGSDITLVDKSKPGCGASNHSFAWINAGPKSPFGYHDLNRRSMEMWERFVQRLQVDVGLRWGGKVSWEADAARADELLQRTKLLQRWGYPTRLIDSDTLCTLVPGLNPGPVVVAEYSEIEGHVEPPRVVKACVSKTVELGGQMLSDTEVIGIEKDRNSRVVKILTTNGDIECDVLVIAAGTDTTVLANMIGIDIPQQESPGVVVRTDIQTALLTSVPVVYMPPIDQQEQEVHIRQLVDGSFMIGEGSQESLALDDSQDHANTLLDRAVRYFPSISGTKAIVEPVGYRPMPLDGYPVIGWAETSSNVYVVLTHSGVTLAPLFGQIASMEILDDTTVQFMEEYRPTRTFTLNRYEH
jgi:glycine/D-amino acid oxidase-like deaminating enzyme